uniref:BAR domain-containing protein n=1 Tax=Panagrolaimus sp. ES5 TaxID=591445 RepID=A0AC34FA59_9BILA
MNEVFFICSIVKFTKLRLIDLKEEDKEEEEMSSSGGSGGGTPQKDNGIRRLWNKMGGAVEQTKMAPDFVKNVENYDTYKESVDLLVDRLEIAVQQNPNILANSVIECPPNENPHEKTVASLKIYETYFGTDKAGAFKELCEENKKLAQIERTHQIQARKAIRHLRRFYIEEYKVATDERNKLNKAREHMDLMKHEVKQAKTTEQIEKKAVLYEEAVGAFDSQATKVIECLSQLPTIQQAHVKDIVEYFDTIGQLHTKMSAAIAKREF